MKEGEPGKLTRHLQLHATQSKAPSSNTCCRKGTAITYSGLLTLDHHSFGTTRGFGSRVEKGLDFSLLLMAKDALGSTWNTCSNSLKKSICHVSHESEIWGMLHTISNGGEASSTDGGCKTLLIALTWAFAHISSLNSVKLANRNEIPAPKTART